MDLKASQELAREAHERRDEAILPAAVTQLTLAVVSLTRWLVGLIIAIIVVWNLWWWTR